MRVLPFAPFGVVVVLSLSSCGGDLIAPGESPLEPEAQVTTVPAPGGARFGPVVLQRGAGAPDAYRLVVEGRAGLYTVVIGNGNGDRRRRVSSATVAVDGRTVFGPDQFNRGASAGQTDVLEAGLTLGDPSVWDIELRGQPGSLITFSLEPGIRVDSAGASLDLGGGGSLVVPPGALSNQVAITATTLPSPPAGTQLLPGSPGVDLGPDGTQFMTPVEVRLGYDQSLLPPGIDEANLRLFTVEDGRWVPVPGSAVDVDADVVSGRISHFSEYAPLPALVTFCPGGSGFASLPDAQLALAEGGIIEVCDGTHAVEGVTLSKPLTIQPEVGAHPVLRSPAGAVLVVDGLTAGTISLRGMTIEASIESGVWIKGTYDQVHLTDVTSTLPTAALAGLRVDGTGNVPGAKVVVQGSHFQGGAVGVYALSGATVDLMDSETTGTRSAGAFYSSAASGTVARNSFRACGGNYCVYAGGGKGATVLDNTLYAEGSAPVRYGILVRTDGSGPTEVRGNHLLGTGVPSDRTAQAAYPFTYGVAVFELTHVGTEPTVVSANRIVGASSGLYSLGDSVSGSDNVVDSSVRPLLVSNPGGRFALHRNDFTDWIEPFSGNLSLLRAGDLTCNWWGSSTQPNASAAASVSRAAFLPVSDQPIAGTAVACDPTPQLPSVVRVAAADNGSGLPFVPSLQAALSLVADSGLVLIAAGVHPVQGVPVRRPVTIQAEDGSRPVFDVGGAEFGIVVGATPWPLGHVTIRGVRMENAFRHALQIQEAYDSVIVEDVEFQPSQGNFNSSGVAALWGTGRGVVVRHSTFTGGRVGVLAMVTAGVKVEANAFQDQSGASVWFENSATTGRIQGNSFTGCADAGCVWISATGRVDVRSNTFTIDLSRPVYSVLSVNGEGVGRHAVEYNTITGTGGLRSPTDAQTWPIRGPGLQVTGADSVIFRGNTIDGAYMGLSLGYSNRSQVLVDNVVRNTVTALLAPGLVDRVSIHGNDFTGYLRSIDAGPAASLGTGIATCNWWGTLVGPGATASGVSSGVYTPWATAPIAFTGQTSCNGAPPTLVRVDPLSPDPANLVFATLAEGVGAVATGGRVLLSDATHSVGDLFVDKPVVILSGGPWRPTLDAGGRGSHLVFSQAVGDSVVLKRVRLTNATWVSVRVNGSVNHARIEDVEFELGPSVYGVILHHDGSLPAQRAALVSNRFQGGHTSVFVPVGLPNLSLVANAFTPSSGANAVVVAASGATHLAGNTFTSCGACVSISPATNGAAPGLVGLYSNTFIADPTIGPSHYAISVVGGGDVTIQGNSMTSRNAPNNPADPESFGFRWAGVIAQNSDSVTVNNNLIDGARQGIQVRSGVRRLVGLDNAVSNVVVGIDGALSPAALSIHSSDFTSYVVAMNGSDLAPGSLTCNWWGSPAGPQGGLVVNPGVYTPWATAPVRGTSTRSC